MTDDEEPEEPEEPAVGMAILRDDTEVYVDPVKWLDEMLDDLRSVDRRVGKSVSARYFESRIVEPIRSAQVAYAAANTQILPYFGFRREDITAGAGVSFTDLSETMMDLYVEARKMLDEVRDTGEVTVTQDFVDNLRYAITTLESLRNTVAGWQEGIDDIRRGVRT